MKDIISILEENENNQLDLWFDLDDKGTERLLNKVLNYALENPDKVKSYCSNIIPQKYSSLSIVYEALSRNHREWGAFLHDEIVRIVDLVERKEIPSSCLSVLNAIDSEHMYSNSKDQYNKIMQYLISKLNIQGRDRFNTEILNIVDWFLAETDGTSKSSEFREWTKVITELANNGSFKVKTEARKVLANTEESFDLKPLTFFEKIRSIF